MTCIVGIKTHDDVLLASDSMSASSAFKNVSTTPKLVRLTIKQRGLADETLIVGFTTSWRMGNLLRYVEGLKHPATMDAEEWMVTQFVPSVRTLFKDGGFLAKERDREEGGTFLVGCCGKLFCVQDDFSVLSPSEGYDACGSGFFLAIGSLHTTVAFLTCLPKQGCGWRLRPRRRTIRLAAAGYDMAKTAAKFATSERLIAKARQLQGDALLIECRAKVKIADEWDAAQAAGQAAKGGRPKKNGAETVSDQNGFTAEQAGLTRQEIFEARKLRDAEAKAPGIAERAMVRGIGTRSASKEERGDDFYQTPREAIHALLCVEQFSQGIWEPSCGHGAISKPMEDAGYDLTLSDLVDRGCADAFGCMQETIDFLATGADSDEPFDCDIVTNPPFGIVNEYIQHALLIHRPRKMAMLLNLNAMCGAENARRNFWMEQWPPARIWVFSRRLPMMHRDGWDGPISGSQMNTAWFVWQRELDAGSVDEPVYGSQTLLKRLDWKAFVDVAALGPEVRG